MKRLSFFLLTFILALTACRSTQEETDFAAYVNPMVGTDAHGHTFPGAILPFGMVQLSPDTRLDGWDGCSGYHYFDSIIYGFSHTHLSGTGCSDYGDVLLMPFCGQGSVINNEYASPFSHDNESASPGYYAVLLDKDSVLAELTASTRVGVHRYTFPEGVRKKGVVIDLKHRDYVLFSALEYDAERNALFGIRNSKAWNEHQKLAFSILFSQPIASIDFYVDDRLTNAPMRIEGTNCKAIVTFADTVKTLVAKVALSSNTEERDAAFKNQAEIVGFDFDKVKTDARALWNKELSKIKVSSSDVEKKRVFYTAMYHAFTAPNNFTDADGRYLGMDGKMHSAKGQTVYTVFSLWDTYRALHPLLTLIDRERTGDFIQTFIHHYEQGGQLPVWELAAFETWCMIGYHSVPVIYDAYVKGIADYDPAMMLDAMVASAKLNKFGRHEYAQYGYVPGDMEHESVSKTLEYAYDDWCIAQFAKAIGNEAVYREFNERCQYYKNLLDAQGFMRPKLNGGFKTPFNPTEVDNFFTEGNSWQYSTYVPHDITTYIDLLGGEDVLDAFLDSLFHTTAKLSGRHQVDVTGLIGQYAHGNEPSHHAAYLYNYVHKPWKTQALVRRIMRELYTSEPDGLCGNEDCGQMSAWYIMSAIGFYPVCPGSNEYELGSPIFDKAVVELENGKQFTVSCKNQSDKNVYIRSAKLNGKNYTKSYLTFDDIANGGHLELVMASKPNTERGTAVDDVPTRRVEPLITIVPSVSPTKQSFKEAIDISFSLYAPQRRGSASCAYPAETDAVYYTTDGSLPTVDSQRYTAPIHCDSSITLRAVAYNAATGYSKVVDSQFFKYEQNKTIEIFSTYNKQYTADGDEGLIDNLRGKMAFSLGGWQGYQGQDFEAIVDLGSVKPIVELGAGFLQNTRSWIFFPTSVTFEVSDDKHHFRHYGSYNNPYSYTDETPKIDDFTVKKRANARYVRVKAKNFGLLPEWHLGAGYPSFIFIDEILIK